MINLRHKEFAMTADFDNAVSAECDTNIRLRKYRNRCLITYLAIHRTLKDKR